MIKSISSRIGVIGASDTRFVMMNYNTETFKSWWAEKMGIKEPNYISNIYTDVGTMLEVPVIKKYFGKKKVRLGRKIQSKEYPKLVVNLDADYEQFNIEVKCVKYNKAFLWQFKIDKNYYQQTQVQMLASGLRKTILLAYGLKEKDYSFDNLVNPKIDKDRIFEFPIEYDTEWLEEQYIPRLIYLSECLENNKIPENIF